MDFSYIETSYNNLQTEFEQDLTNFLRSNSNDLFAYILDDEADLMEIDFESQATTSAEPEKVFTDLETAKFNDSVDESSQNFFTISYQLDFQDQEIAESSIEVKIENRESLTTNNSKSSWKKSNRGRPRVSESVHLEKLSKENDPKKRKIISNNAASIRSRLKKAEKIKEIARKIEKAEKTFSKLRSKSQKIESQIQELMKILGHNEVLYDFN